MARHNELGKWGEEQAVGRLVADGYAIRERNWRMGRYEIDIVAMQGATIVFCEVKTRSGSDPFDAIDSRRINHMVASARVYMEANKIEALDVRFDVIGICGTPETGHSLEHVCDAFDVPLTTY